MSKLNLIQCGVGGFGGGWIERFTSTSPDFELVAIVDVSEKKLQEAGEKFKVPADRRFTSLEEAVDEVPADAVLTVTPPAIHVEHARIAFANGLHLMTEKPIADTLEHAKEMVQRARQSQRQLLVSQNYRYSAIVQGLRSSLENGSIGELGHGHLDFFIPADFTGSFREAMEYVLLVDMAIHHFDLIRCVTGRNIVNVHTQSYRPPWSWYKHHPAANVLMELESNVPFTYCGDWSAKGRCTSWNGDWRLQGSEGSLHMEGNRLQLAKCDRWQKNPTNMDVPFPELPKAGQSATLSHFAEAIRTGEPGPTNGADNLWSFGAVIAAVQSAREGRTVDVRELIR